MVYCGQDILNIQSDLLRIRYPVWKIKDVHKLPQYNGASTCDIGGKKPWLCKNLKEGESSAS